MAVNIGGGNNQDKSNQNANQQKRDGRQPQPEPSQFRRRPADFDPTRGASRNRQDNPGGDSNLASLWQALGASTISTGAPEIAAAIQQINEEAKHHREARGQNHPVEFLAFQLDGQSRTPYNMLTLVVAALDTATGYAAFTLVFPESTAKSLDDSPRQVPLQDRNNGGRQFSRPDTLAERVMYGQIKKGGESISALAHYTNLVEEQLARRFNFKNAMSISHVGILIVPLTVGFGKTDPIDKGDIANWLSVLENVIAGNKISDEVVTVNQSLRELARSARNFTVTVHLDGQDVLRSDGVAIRSNIRFVVSAGIANGRRSSYGDDGDNGDTVTRLGTVYASGELVHNTAVNRGSSINPRDNPLFLSALTITGISTDTVFNGMGYLLIALVSKAVNPRDIVSVSVGSSSALRNPGTIGVLDELFGSNCLPVEMASGQNLPRTVMGLTSESVYVRIACDPSDINTMACFSDLFHCAWGGDVALFEDRVMRTVEAMFSVQANDIGALTSPGGVMYTGHIMVGDTPVSLAAIDCIAVLTAGGNTYEADTNGALYFGSDGMTDQACLTEHAVILSSYFHTARTRSIALGVYVNPDFLSLLLAAVQEAGIQVMISSSATLDLERRDFSAPATGFNARRNNQNNGRHSGPFFNR
jgi:hypothetical protein